MSNEEAVKAAKKAEEALNKVRETEAAKLKAELAFEAAKMEAKVAAEAAKLAGKKKTNMPVEESADPPKDKETWVSEKIDPKETLEDDGPLISDIEAVPEDKAVVEATQEKSSSGADKKLILDFLQKKSWDLRRTITGVVDIRFEDEPPRVIFAVVSPEVKIPKLEHNGVEINFELEVRAAVPTGTVSVGEDGTEDTAYHRSISGEGAKVLGVTEAVGPHSASTEAAKQRKAYEDWLKRHPGVKRQ